MKSVYKVENIQELPVMEVLKETFCFPRYKEARFGHWTLSFAVRICINCLCCRFFVLFAL